VTSVLEMHRELTSLPASDLIESGLRDLRERRETIASLLVSIGAPKLRNLGFDIPHTDASFGPHPEHRLYDLLAIDNPDTAHSKYNALIRKLVSFERAIPCARK
jgi:hypothetical protein